MQQICTWILLRSQTLIDFDTVDQLSPKILMHFLMLPFFVAFRPPWNWFFRFMFSIVDLPFTANEMRNIFSKNVFHFGFLIFLPVKMNKIKSYDKHFKDKGTCRINPLSEVIILQLWIVNIKSYTQKTHRPQGSLFFITGGL